jgi:integrase
MLYARQAAPTHANPALVGYMTERLVQFWGDKTLADVKASTCRAYAEHRTAMVWRGKPVSSSTARRELGMLSAAINVWHRESPLDTVPAVTLPARSPARQRWLSRGEAARLLWAARRNRHLVRFILIGLYTGTRHAAILSLRWLPSPDGGWIDVDKGVIHRRGFGERDTKKRRTPARIPDRLLAHLRRWQAMDSAQGIVGVVTWQGRRIAKERRAFAQAVARAGLGPDVTPHVLRHTCATWALNSRMSAWDVAALLGTSVQMIEATYGHHSPEFQAAAAGLGRRR